MKISGSNHDYLVWANENGWMYSGSGAMWYNMNTNKFKINSELHAGYVSTKQTEKQ